MYLVFDIGATNMRLAVSSNGKSFDALKIDKTPQDFAEGIALFQALAAELTKGMKVTACAGGVAGPLDSLHQTILHSPNLPDWSGKLLSQSLSDVLGVPVTLLNDTIAAALGEALVGSGNGEKVVAYFTVSTGVGGARIVNGKVETETSGFEPGHQIVVPEGLTCGCGGKGHLEAYISGTAFKRRFGRDAKEVTDPKAFEEAAKLLGQGLYNSALHWMPDVIVLGGSMILGNPAIPLASVETAFKDFATVLPKIPRIAKASLGDECGLYGALHYLSKKDYTN